MLKWSYINKDINHEDFSGTKHSFPNYSSGSREALKNTQESHTQACTINFSSLALNGGGRIFSLPVLALIFPACSLVSSHLLRDSLCTALQTERKIMDLINWSLNAIDTIGFWGTCEDIYLFGTMLTGILLIGLGFALGYRRIQKTGTAVQSLTRLPVMIESSGKSGQH